jgi:CDP-diacylglycerol--glycerol-3-phosphate 3-phosphatidyltransferase
MLKRENLTVPNFITTLRILGAVSLFFTDVMSIAFYVIYSFCGLTDVLDGFIARVTKTTSELGARLDSVADLLFYSVMLIKLLPFLWINLPQWIWIFVGGVLVIRIASYLVAAIKYRRFASLHTYLNKLTGAVLFAVPYFMGFKAFFGICLTVCIVSGGASLEELVLHLSAREYDSGKKSLAALFHKV